MKIQEAKEKKSRIQNEIKKQKLNIIKQQKEIEEYE